MIDEIVRLPGVVVGIGELAAVGIGHCNALAGGIIGVGDVLCVGVDDGQHFAAFAVGCRVTTGWVVHHRAIIRGVVGEGVAASRGKTLADTTAACVVGAGDALISGVDFQRWFASGVVACCNPPR